MRYWQIVNNRVRSFERTDPPPQVQESLAMPPIPPKVKGATGRTHRTLGFSQKIMVYQWIQARRDRLLTDRPTHASMAELVSKELNLDVSTDTFKAMCRQKPAVLWHAKANRSSAGKNYNRLKSYVAIRAEITIMRQQIDILRNALAEYMDSQDADYDEALHISNWPTYTPPADDTNDESNDESNR